MPQPLRLALLAFVVLGIVGLLIYAFVRALKKSEDPARFAFKWILTVVIAIGLFVFSRRMLDRPGGVSFVEGAVIGAIVAFAALAASLIFTIMWGPSIIHTLFSPLLSAFDGGDEEPDPVPLYSTAQGLRQRGKHRESLYAIQEQLQKFPNDFTGQMMIAEIHAENLNDLAAAETDVHRLCAQPKQSPTNLAYALNTLADWQLKYAQDAEAARGALEKIRTLLPDTEFARVAANRIAHLASTEQLIAAREPSVVKMKPGVEYLGLLKSQEHLLPKVQDPKDETKELVAHLEVHPQDQEARERLAVLYARIYGRIDFAAEQIELLVAQPGESPKHIARWLNLLADLQIELTGQTEAAAVTLQRIVDLFPNHSLAQKAGERIGSLKQELRRFEEQRVVKFTPTAAERPEPPTRRRW